MEINKEFDAVQMMRKIRDEISLKLKDKSFKEQHHYIRKQITPFDMGHNGKDDLKGRFMGPANRASLEQQDF